MGWTRGICLSLQPTRCSVKMKGDENGISAAKLTREEEGKATTEDSLMTKSEFQQRRRREARDEDDVRDTANSVGDNAYVQS